MGSLTRIRPGPAVGAAVKWEVPPTVRTVLSAHDFRENPLPTLPTLQRRQLVGHDILLARHGNHISAMRVDRAAGRVVAYLDDGSVDSAPNLISPSLQMPATMRSVLREDWKFLSIVTGASFGVAGTMFAAAIAVANWGGSRVIGQLLSGYSGA